MSLADVQRAVTEVLLTGAPERETLPLVGGQRPDRRLQIHARHYTASLTRAVAERFPATAWLVGSALVVDAARAFAQAHPPTRPCIAEYGDTFPAFLAARVPSVGYLEPFATLDWHLGCLALAADVTTVCVDVDWSVDELITFYLTDTAPDHYEIRHEHARLELRGSRGELWIQRI